MVIKLNTDRLLPQYGTLDLNGSKELEKSLLSSLHTIPCHLAECQAAITYEAGIFELTAG